MPVHYTNSFDPNKFIFRGDSCFDPPLEIASIFMGGSKHELPLDIEIPYSQERSETQMPLEIGP